MPTDYDKIRNENIREYGEGTRHLSFLGNLYTDRTHFIFELLQNAEDAGATKIQFNLVHDRLEVLHNGRIFNELDVKGVCGVGEGTKSEDLTQIGKFGIGFKSVYAYTETPEVHSGDESFKIASYVRPHAVSSKPIGDSWTTLFVFPFNSKKVTSESAKDEIGDRLCNLSTRTLLFLRNIEQIEYKLPNLTSGFYFREESERGLARQVSVIGENNNEDEDECWLLFERGVATPDFSGSVSVELGFQIETQMENGKNSERIIKAKNTPLVVYFPTEKETRLGFLIQGPYRTTPARDNIPTDDECNKTLVLETAKLIKYALSEMRELGLISVSLLEALPIRPDDFPENGMFYPIFEAVRKSLNEDELLPADDNSFVSAENAKLARGSNLRKLLSQKQLSQLDETGSIVKWLVGDITEVRTADLRSYLLNELAVEEMTPEKFAGKINHAFLCDQPDEWFIDLYKYLSDQEKLWRKSSWNTGSNGILRSKPILRLNDGSQTTPFLSDGVTPKAFLPPKEKTDFQIVGRSIVTNEQARTFLERLGLSEPDVFDEIVKTVFPKYTAEGSVLISDAEHQADIDKVVRAMDSDSELGKKKVIQAISETPFLKATDASGVKLFKKPSEIYLDTSEMRMYFSSVSGAWFLADQYAISGIETRILCDFGVSDLPRRLKRHGGLPDDLKEHTTQEGTIENHELDGLEQFLESVQNKKDFEEQRKVAFVLWIFLKEHLNRNLRFFKAKYTWFYYKWREKYFNSKIFEQLQSSSWIPTKDGELEIPDKVTKDKLFEEFLEATELIEELGISDDTILTELERKRDHAKELGVSLEDIEIMKNHHDEFEQFKKNISDREQNPAFPIKPVRNPDRRREKIRKQYSDAPLKRYRSRRKPSRPTSGTIDPTTPLRMQYTNTADQMVCQICKKEMPFRKRNGEYYFETREILSRDQLPKEHEAQYLALCPLCSAKYFEFVINVDSAEAELRERILKSEDCEIEVSFGDEKASILFVESHYLDLKVIIEELELSSDSVNGD